MQVAAKLERALADHKRELDVREEGMHEARAHMATLQQAHAAALTEVEEARAAAADMQVG